MQLPAPQKLISRLLLLGIISISLTSLASATTPDDASQLTAALDQLDEWVGPEANGNQWRKYLASRTLRAQIAKGAKADPAIVSRVLEQYLSGAKGLDKSRFVKVRQEIESWRDALQQQYVDDLPKLAWASRGDYRPASREQRLSPSRTQLLQTTQALEQTLGTNSQFAENWKQYLRWDRLAPHLTGDASVDAQATADLAAVLKRFRSNAAGLENPAFTATAEALDQYLGMFQWYQLVGKTGQRARKKYGPRALERRTYLLQLSELEKQLTRHQQSPSIETSRKVGQLLALVQQLEQSPQLVQAIRTEFTQPNVLAEVTESALQRLAQRPIDETQSVRDCILGARVCGLAHSTGCLALNTLASPDHVSLELQLTGTIHSDTVGHKKPVRITSHSHTNFVSTKHLQISDDKFLALPAYASAHTKTNIRSVKKTGGNFARGLIERIAWKKVGESKSQGEYIASQRAKQKVNKKFDNQIAEALLKAWGKYDQKARTPLIRRGMFPENFQMSSTDHAINVGVTLASCEQMSTNATPIAMAETPDFSMTLHESAVNNFLPSILAGVGIKQDSQAAPPQLLGDYPPWLKELTDKHSDKLSGEGSTKEPSGEASEKFKPFSVLLNRTHPLSVQFDNQQVKLRIRIAELKTVEDGEEQIRENWDLILTFDLVQDGNGIILRRVGDIDAFPTGFDPTELWGDRLPNEAVATRGALSKILKKRADSENGLPKEITIPPLQLPNPSGDERTLILQHLDCDNGWLTLGYQLP